MGWHRGEGHVKDSLLEPTLHAGDIRDIVSDLPERSHVLAVTGYTLEQDKRLQGKRQGRADWPSLPPPPPPPHTHTHHKNPSTNSGGSPSPSSLSDCLLVGAPLSERCECVLPEGSTFCRHCRCPPAAPCCSRHGNGPGAPTQLSQTGPPARGREGTVLRKRNKVRNTTDNLFYCNEVARLTERL